MKVILLKDVKNVGRKYDVKDVSEGFAMNSLIPRGLAQAAVGGALRRVEALKAKGEAARAERDAKLSENLGKIEEVEVRMRGKANEQGHLFASVHKEEVAEAFRNQSGMELDAEHIELDKPLKEAGEHHIHVNLGGKKGRFRLVIDAE